MYSKRLKLPLHATIEKFGCIRCQKMVHFLTQKIIQEWSSQFWSFFGPVFGQKMLKKQNSVIIISTLCLISSSRIKVISRSLESSSCFKFSEVFNCFPDLRFDHVWILLRIIFCSKDSSRIQEKVENMKNLKL